MTKRGPTAILAAISLTLTICSIVPVPAGAEESRPVAAQTVPQVPDKVLAPSLLEYKVVIPGDGLERVARRFGVTVDDLLSADLNPQLAARKNPNLLYLGETIKIRLYKPKTRAISSLENTDMIMFPKAEALELLVSKSEAELLKTELSKLESSQEASIAALVLMVVLSAGLSFALIWRITSNQKDGAADEIVSAPVEMPKTLINSNPREVLDLLKTARWQTVVEVNDLPIAADERGHTTLKKAREFTEKRPYLLGIQIAKTAQAIEEKRLADLTTKLPGPATPPVAAG